MDFHEYFAIFNLPVYEKENMCYKIMVTDQKLF
jgi:hypothetical protein